MSVNTNETWHPQNTQQRVGDLLLENKHRHYSDWRGLRQGADMGDGGGGDPAMSVSACRWRFIWKGGVEASRQWSGEWEVWSKRGEEGDI